MQGNDLDLQREMAGAYYQIAASQGGFRTNTNENNGTAALGSYRKAAALREADDPVDRTLWLYDTFAGMTTPGEEDRSLNGEAAADVLARLRPDDPRRACGVDEVRANVAETGWPEERAR